MATQSSSRLLQPRKTSFQTLQSSKRYHNSRLHKGTPTRGRPCKSGELKASGSSIDISSGSIDDEAMISELERVEVKEPKIESSAELAAATVIGAVAFGAGIWAFLGPQKGEEYFAGYLLEQSLSVDNLFVFILVFDYFKTPLDYQNKVLTYGIGTAAILRLVLIVLGVDIVDRFQPVLLIFAAILVVSSLKLLTGEDDEEDDDLSNNKIVSFCRRLIPFTDDYDGDNFFMTLANGTKVATPLLLVLMVVEISDVVFAVDSIPAVFGVTLDPFIVYTSNMWAILSLRGLYGFVCAIMGKLEYLDKAVALVLGFVGLKILAEYMGFEIETSASLGIVTSILSGGVALSYLLPSSEKK